MHRSTSTPWERCRRASGRAGTPIFTLLIAWAAVWLTVRFLVPIVLGLLSMLFGKALRRAASACVRAAKRSQSAIGRASSWLSGHRKEDTLEPAPVRVTTELDRVRVAQALGIAQAEAPGREAEVWMSEQLVEAESQELDEEPLRRRRRSVPSKRRS